MLAAADGGLPRAALIAPAAAQDDYPNKPVRVIVPFAPGGLNDILARMVSAQLSERLGKQFIVENKTGAGGVVGSELVAKSPADGYTLLIVSIAHAVNPCALQAALQLAQGFHADLARSHPARTRLRSIPIFRSNR